MKVQTVWQLFYFRRAIPSGSITFVMNIVLLNCWPACGLWFRCRRGTFTKYLRIQYTFAIPHVESSTHTNPDCTSKTATRTIFIHPSDGAHHQPSARAPMYFCVRILRRAMFHIAHKLLAPPRIASNYRHQWACKQMGKIAGAPIGFFVHVYIIQFEWPS